VLPDRGLAIGDDQPRRRLPILRWVERDALAEVGDGGADLLIGVGLLRLGTGLLGLGLQFPSFGELRLDLGAFGVGEVAAGFFGGVGDLAGGFQACLYLLDELVFIEHGCTHDGRPSHGGCVDLGLE
jgi:hypothetical protein